MNNYSKLLEKAREVYKNCVTGAEKRRLETIFPELKESEDEYTWSKEDEKMIDSIIDEIYPIGECPDYPTIEEQDYYYNLEKMVDWLKSLKSRFK